MAKARTARAPVAPATDKDKAADVAAAAIEARFGEGSFAKLGTSRRLNIDVIPTGIYQVDNFVIGAGGFPKGRISEVLGPFSSGKTTIALAAVAQCQLMGGKAAFLDVENSLDPAWARINGVNTDELFISQPSNGEEAFEIADAVIRSGAFDILVVDSVAALVPKAELEGSYGDSNVGLHARLMSQAMRRLTGIINDAKIAVIFINQIREKIGVMFGSPETTTGGRALPFFASLRLDVRKTGYLQVSENDPPYGNKVKVKAVKNKVGPPFRELEDVVLLYDSGFDKVDSLIKAGKENGAIEVNGSWYSYKGEKLGQGIVATANLLRSSEERYREIYAAVVQADNEPKSV